MSRELFLRLTGNGFFHYCDICAVFEAVRVQEFMRTYLNNLENFQDIQDQRQNINQEMVVIPIINVNHSTQTDSWSENSNYESCESDDEEVIDK